MGITFKENCNDYRNSKPFEFYKLLSKNKNFKVDVHDPFVDKNEIKKDLNLNIIKTPATNKYDAIVLLVKHKQYTKLSYQKLTQFSKKDFILFDIKNVFFKKFKKSNVFTI